MPAARGSISPGFVLLSMALTCLLTGLSNGQREGWQSDYILGLFAAAIASTLGFFAWELRAARPLVNLRVLGNAQFTCAATVAFIFGAGLFGSTYLVPLFVQTVQHLTPLAAGLLLMPAGLILGVFMPIGGYMSDRISARKLIIAGLMLFRPLGLSAGGDRRQHVVLDHRLVRRAVARRARASSSRR